MVTESAINSTAVFNVRAFGASGNKADDAQAAIQQAIDACAAAGGGVVYFPPGAYTSGTIHLRSHVRIHIEAGATVYSSKDRSRFDKHALFYGEDADNISLEGRGTVHGQAEYVHRLHDMKDWYIYPNQLLAEKAGMPLMRAFPTPESYGNLVLLVHCADVRIEGLSFLESPSWTMHLFGCDRLVIDGVYVHTSLQDGVWADGIDPDGCKDVHINNCTIETGDDALVFYCGHTYGPARPCENITVTNCRLSSASSALKFCDGNELAIRNVTIDNCVITGSNRGIAFMVFDGGTLENVIISNVTVECKPFDWFWWGDSDPIHFNMIRRHEIDPNIDPAKEPPIGKMRNILLRNVIARGPGPCHLHANPDSPLENITLENIRLTVTSDLATPLQKGEYAITLDNARNVRLKDVEVMWDAPGATQWRGALLADHVRGLLLDGISARQAPSGEDAPAVVLRAVEDAVVRDCRAQQGTGTFLRVEGDATRDVTVRANDLRAARTPVEVAAEVRAGAVSEK